MKPHYYLMKCKKILRLEEVNLFETLPLFVKENVFSCDISSLDQEQANWRVVIFRDEIMELEEYISWLSSSEAYFVEEEHEELELIAN